MLKNDTSKKWKDSLLKSSLPLELLVSEIMYKCGISLSGEYSYIRQNEIGQDKEFSIDQKGLKIFEKDETNLFTLNFLIECKYNYPGVKWIFSPFIDELPNTYVGYLSIFQELCTRRIDDNLFSDVEANLNCCIKGIELHKDDKNSQSISRGLNQLKYAIPHEVNRIYSSQISCIHDSDLNIEILCPILITTSV